MGFSTSGATAIIVIGVLVSAATLVPAVEDAREARTAGLDAKEDRMLDRQNTDIAMIDAVYDADNDTLDVRVNNTGTESLDANRTDLLVDGEYVDADTAVAGTADRTLWTPGTQLTLSYDTTTEPARVQVATELGIKRASNVTVEGGGA